MDETQDKLKKSLDDMDARVMWSKRLLCADKNLCKYSTKLNESLYQSFFGWLDEIIMRTLILELCLIFDKSKPKWQENINLNVIFEKFTTNNKIKHPSIYQKLIEAQKLIKDNKLMAMRNTLIAHSGHNKPNDVEIPIYIFDKLLELAQEIIIEFRKILSIPPMVEPINYEQFDPSIRQLIHLIQQVINNK